MMKSQLVTSKRDILFALMLGVALSIISGNVQFERHGYLYVKVGDEVIKVENPYDYIPDNVHLRKYKGTYKVVKEKENKE